MKSEGSIRIGVAENATMVRLGLSALLKRLPNLIVQVIELSTVEALKHCVKVQKIDILIVSPQFGGWFNVREFKHQYSTEDFKTLALITTMVPETELRNYDDTLTLFDDAESIAKKISTILNIEEEEEETQDTLSQREREIVAYIVKGFTNKEIADALFLSVHTIITHRRNIARKLQIHSAAGLTIYAIVNKIVELNEVKMNL